MSRPVLPGRPRPGALVRDGVVSALAQPVATAIAALVVAMVCLVVLLTTGRSAAAEHAVIASIESVGTRLIVVTDSTGRAGIESASVPAIEDLTGVTWAFGLGPARDARNPDVPSRITQVPVRPLVGTLPPEVRVTVGRFPAAPHEAVVGPQAAAALGLGDIVGALRDGEVRIGVVGQFAATGPLEFLNGTVLRQAEPGEQFPVRYIYVVVDDAAESPQIAQAIGAVLLADDATQVDIATSEGVIALRDVIAGTLGASSRQLMAGLLSVGLVLVTVTMLGAVAGRRRDFGRRRALGASKSAIVVLVLVQTAVAAVAGAVVGTAAGLAGVRATAGAIPSVSFTVGLAVLTVLVALVGSAPPAFAAASRDPVRILRVP